MTCLCLFAPCPARFARCCMSLSCHFHTLLPFTCAGGSCLSPTRGRPHGCEFCEISSFFCVRPGITLRFLQLSSFDQASCLVVSGHSSTQTCVCALVDRSTLLVKPDYSLSCPHLFWHRFIGCRSRLFIAWTDVFVFLHFGFVRPAFEVRTKCGATFMQLMVSFWPSFA